MAFEDLPKIDTAAINSAESTRAFEAVFSLPKFIPRVQNPDYGTDYEVELCADSQAQNIKFSAQLKSADEIEVDKEACEIKLKFPVGRLNYLSRTICGALVVVYDVGSKTLFYEWVDKLIPALDAKGPEWRRQDSTTIRVPLANVLNPTTTAEIHARVTALYSGIASSKQNERDIPSSAPSGNSPFSGKSGEELLKFLEDQGGHLVSLGWHKEVIDAFASVPSSRWQSNPKHLLAIAYAYERSGLPLQALTYSNAALACDEKKILGDDDRAFAEAVALSSKKSIGTISRQEFNAGLSGIGKKYPNTLQAKIARLEEIFQLILRSRKSQGDHLRQIEELIAEARGIAGEMDPGDISQWASHLQLARVEFEAGTQYFLHGAFAVRIAAKVRRPMPPERKLEKARVATAHIEAAVNRMQSLLQAAITSKRFDLVASCNYDLAVHLFTFLRVSAAVQGRSDDLMSIKDSPQLRDCIARAGEAARIYAAMSMEGECLRALRLKADILNASGSVEEAKKIIADVRGRAASAGLGLEQFQLTSFNVQQKAKQTLYADWDDNEIERCARDLADSLGLPSDRLPNIIKDVRASKALAQHRRSWCRHLELLQELAHGNSAHTHYSIDPNRIAHCNELGITSKVTAKDPEALLKAFEDTHCVGCPKREPSKD